MMQKKTVSMFLLLHALLMPIHGSERCSEHLKRTENSLPALRLTLAPDTCTEDTAFFFLAETGDKNYRINGTYGINLQTNLRLKAGVEFLAQRIRYDFSRRSSYRWTKQWAAGFDYQYLYSHSLIYSLDLSFDFSQSMHQRLHQRHCNGERTLMRRLAAGSFYDLGAGATLLPWSGGQLSLALNYDYTCYRKKFGTDKRLKGLGGSFLFGQQLTQNINFTLEGRIRRPFNYLGGTCRWSQESKWGAYNIGLYTDHAWGRDKQYSSTSFGIEIGFDFVPESCRTKQLNFCLNERNCCTASFTNTLKSWVRTPAVYIPEVLTIPEQMFLCNSVAVKQIPDQTINNTTGSSFLSLDLSQYLYSDGSSLIYTGSFVSDNPDGPYVTYFNVNPSSGFLVLIDPGGFLVGENLTVTVHASNSCGEQTAVFHVHVVPLVGIPQ